MRDDFTKKTIQILSDRAGNQCSNPNCNQITQGPDNKNQCINIGVASHISAASPGGPRYNSNITSDERKDINNGIWLCQNCAKLIDSDPEYYTCELLQMWKESHEKFIAYELAHPRKSSITDKQLIEFFLMCFTRPAFTHPIVQEGNNEDLYRAICDTIVALSTGILYSRDGRVIENKKGINYIKSSALKQGMYNIRDILSTIKDRMETEIKENRFFSREGNYCFDNKTTQYFYDAARSEILLIINNLANAFGINSDLSIKDRYNYNHMY
ncbi:MAG: HNH endonuclease [Tenericutes bacterium]|nr:HNH endonuclease [Mycoplasmatota bacterium]